MRTWNEWKTGRCARDTGVCFRNISNEKFVRFGNWSDGRNIADGCHEHLDREGMGLAVDVHPYAELKANKNHFSCALRQR